jgi:putative transposase
VKKSRFTEEQIAFGLKQAELETSVPEIFQKMGISEAAFSNWKK